MSKPELGVKRDCPECSARFYDLNKHPAHCPKCDHEFTPEALLKPRKQRIPDEPVAKPKEKTKPVEETSLEEAEKQKKAPESKRKAALDENSDDDDDDDNEDDDLKAIADLGVDLDDDDDDDDDNETDNTLLVADEDDGDVTAIVPKKGGDDT